MSERIRGRRVGDVAAGIRARHPELERVEKEMGSRLVVARNVIRLRVQRGYTQKQLADELGVTQPRVAEIESARGNLQIDTLDRLARVFGIEPARLLEPDRPSRRKADAVVKAAEA